MKEYDLGKLHELQLQYMDIIDMSIEVRKDKKCTQVTFCNYNEDFSIRTKLYIHRLYWKEDNTKIFERIEKQLREIYDLEVLERVKKIFKRITENNIEKFLTEFKFDK